MCCGGKRVWRILGERSHRETDMDRKRLVDQSIEYIMQHLDGDLSLNTIASRFYISKYHFSRIFKEETGESPYAFIKRCKLDQSAVDIKLNPEKTITDIGLDYGYSSSNYSSAFKKQRHISPAMFKQAIPTHSMPVPFGPERVVRFQSAEEYAGRIRIQEFDDFFVVYERFIGNYADLEQRWYRFLDRYEAYRDEDTVLIERFFHDPAITDIAQCICDIGMAAGRDCGLEPVMRIEGGRWAVYHYDGGIEDIFGTLEGIFSVWLPQSGYRMARRYGMNIYRRMDRDRHSVALDLCIPIV